MMDEEQYRLFISTIEKFNHNVEEFNRDVEELTKQYKFRIVEIVEGEAISEDELNTLKNGALIALLNNEYYYLTNEDTYFYYLRNIKTYKTAFNNLPDGGIIVGNIRINKSTKVVNILSENTLGIGISALSIPHNTFLRENDVIESSLIQLAINTGLPIKVGDFMYQVSFVAFALSSVCLSCIVVADNGTDITVFSAAVGINGVVAKALTKTL